MGLQAPSVSSSKVIVIKTVRLFLVFSRSCEGEMPGKVVSKEKWKKSWICTKSSGRRSSEFWSRAASSNIFEEQSHNLFGTVLFSFIGLTYNKLLLWTMKFGLCSWGLSVPLEQMTSNQEILLFFSPWASPLPPLCLNFPICKCLLSSAELAVDLLLPPAE